MLDMKLVLLKSMHSYDLNNYYDPSNVLLNTLDSNSNLDINTNAYFTFFDLTGEKTLWDIPLASAPLVKPFVINQKILLFLESGDTLLLDEATGKVLKTGFNLPEGLFPSTTPYQGTDESLFIPFTDGTVLQTTLKELTNDS
jgi:hypothetical protein